MASASLNWKCDACTFENNAKDNPNRCSMCNTQKDYISKTQNSRDIIINKYKEKYGIELLSFFYPYPITKGCNSGDTAVDCIIDNSIYLSGSYTAQNIKWLKLNQIGSILNCAFTDIKHSIPIYTDKYSILLKQLPINDISKDQNVMQTYINESIQFITECVNKNIKILIHCSAGISRSSTVLIAYLMKANKWDLLKCFKYVRSKRKYIYPNLGFWKLLIELNNKWINERKINVCVDDYDIKIQSNDNDDNNDDDNVINSNDLNTDNVLSTDILAVHAEELGKMKGTMYSSVRRDKVKLWCH